MVRVWDSKRIDALPRQHTKLQHTMPPPWRLAPDVTEVFPLEAFKDQKVVAGGVLVLADEPEHLHFLTAEMLSEIIKEFGGKLQVKGWVWKGGAARAPLPHTTIPQPPRRPVATPDLRQLQDNALP